MVAPKKRITTELLHIALVITLLRGNSRHLEFNDNIISSNFFNDVHDLDHIQGPNWAYTRTNYHHRFIDPSAQQIKSLSGNFNPFIEDGSGLEDDFELDEMLYRQQTRLLMLNRINSNYARKNAPPTFQDITAYLVSDTTTSNVPNVLQVVTPPQPGSSGGGPSVPSPSIDSGHEDSGEDEGRISFSESETDIELVSSIIENQEEHGISVELASEDVLENIGDDLISEEITNSVVDDLFNVDVNLNLELNEADETEYLHFIENNNNVGRGELGAAALSRTEVSSDLAEWDDNLPSSSLVSELFGLDEFNYESDDGNEDMELALAEEEANLKFYKTFNEISDDEMMNTVPLKLFEGEVDTNEEEEEVEKTGSVSDVDDMQGADTSHRDHQTSESDGENDEKNASTGDLFNSKVSGTSLLDEIWETDSGIFDFLESPTTLTEEGAFDFENLDSEDSQPRTVDEESSQGEADDSISVDMIQAAPIHANARPTSHAAQPRGFQVHARMPHLLRGSSMDQMRWQELTSMLSIQQGPHDGSGGPLPPSLTHPFGPHPHHPHHHLHHAPPPLHHHSMHHPPFSSAGPPAAPYNIDSARSVLLQNATLPPPDLNSTTPYSSVGMGPPPNLGSAVTSSMHLTNSSDPMIDPSSHYKMIEPSHDMIYYPNTNNSEMNNQTTEGFFSSILNDDDLQLMDMAMNEGMYTMRMLDNGVGASNSSSLGAAAAIAHGQQPNLPHGAPTSCPTIGPGAIANAEDRMEASSDSAVSSMGSERVPPMTDPTISDNEWVDSESHPHSSHESSPYSLDYSNGKIRGYDYYGKDRVPAPVAQKKHHMFGKRFQQEQGSQPYLLPQHPTSGLHLPYQSSGGLHPSSSMDNLDMKYGCNLEFSRHQNGIFSDHRNSGAMGSADSVHNNHTYSLPPSHPENPLLNVRPPRQAAKDKIKMTEDLDRFAEESLSRDEKRARSMQLPITTEDIINLPMDEFNERLSKYDLSEPQLSLIRDIRRRGKNKVAAQNCRKRKLDQILQLADEVQRIRERKQNLVREQQELNSRRSNLKDRYSLLYRHVFQALRDPEGNAYSPYDFSLQQAADGNIILVPRNASQPSTSNGQDSMNPSNSSRRDKTKDEFKKEGHS